MKIVYDEVIMLQIAESLQVGSGKESLVPGFKPVKFLSAGIGGYAWSIAQHLLNSMGSSEPHVAFQAICDPNPDAFPERLSLLKSKNIRVYKSYDEMIDKESETAEAVWLPLPIHLHRPFAEKALSKGLHVVTEKPAAGSLQDVDAMIAARNKAGREVLVGFQDIYAAQTLPAKRELVNGAIGKITEGTVHASWPRDLSYYSRNQWAGALKVQDSWVLDSPLQNAISHYVNLTLFLMGADLHESAAPVQITAELYRVNKIENYDTCALRVKLSTGSSLLVFFTHASSKLIEPIITLKGTEGSLLVDNNRYTFSGKTQKVFDPDRIKHLHMVQNIARHIRKAPYDGTMATLEIARIHTLLVNGTSEASPVCTVDGEYATSQKVEKNNSSIWLIKDVDKVMKRCVDEHKLPNELGDVGWSRKGGSIDLSNYNAFTAPKN